MVASSWTVEEIRDKLKGMRESSNSGTVSLLGSITDIDPIARTCTLNDNGIAYYGVRLQVVTGGSKGVLVLPKDGSSGLAVRIEETDGWMLLACSKIERVELIINDENIGDLVRDLLKAIRAMKFTTNAGPTIALINDPEFIAIEQRIDKIFK